MPSIMGVIHTELKTPMRHTFRTPEIISFSTSWATWVTSNVTSSTGWWFEPLWKIWKSMKWEGLSYYGKHVSNHQPDMITIRSNMLWWWKSPHLVQWFSQLEASSSVQRRLTSGGQGYPSISHQVSKPRPNHPLNKQCQLLKLLKHPKNHHQSPTFFIFFLSYLVRYLSLLAKFGSGHQGVAWGAPAGSKSVHCLAELPWPPWPPWGCPSPFDPPPQVPNGDQPQNAGHSLVAETMCSKQRCAQETGISIWYHDQIYDLYT